MSADVCVCVYFLFYFLFIFFVLELAENEEQGFKSLYTKSVCFYYTLSNEIAQTVRQLMES